MRHSVVDSKEKIGERVAGGAPSTSLSSFLSPRLSSTSFSPFPFSVLCFLRHRAVLIWRVSLGSPGKHGQGVDVRFLCSIGAAVGSIWFHIWTCGELCLFSLPPLLDLLDEVGWVCCGFFVAGACARRRVVGLVNLNKSSWWRRVWYQKGSVVDLGLPWSALPLVELLVLSCKCGFDSVWRLVVAPSPIKLDLLEACVLGCG
ncbi:hypothetical protein F2Q69_00007823 [Brassica cretica]|uniref:Uncharacterized protein n=1 Tax=Brassica cretica TaxID=69181 RepID=A0A8S9P5D8_BRACR|nr:hypothetical protein F2Q69_00007823 [Brassica cretica]